MLGAVLEFCVCVCVLRVCVVFAVSGVLCQPALCALGPSSSSDFIVASHHVECAAQQSCVDTCVCMFCFLFYLTRLAITTLRSIPHALRALTHLAAIHLLSSLMKQSRLAQGIGVVQTRILLDRS